MRGIAMSQMDLIDEPDDEEREEEPFDIESGEAFVASAGSACRQCERPIEVICLYCRSGRLNGEPLESFRVQCLWAMDDALSRQLQRWPTYHWNAREGRFLNHCHHCGAGQDEELLHEEPGQPFHELARDVSQDVTLRALLGRVRLSGDPVADLWACRRPQGRGDGYRQGGATNAHRASTTACTCNCVPWKLVPASRRIAVTTTCCCITPGCIPGSCVDSSSSAPSFPLEADASVSASVRAC